jgi:AraC family transcriptional regulator of adaptative response / DNA-3-methyladenine glycosylase II
MIRFLKIRAIAGVEAVTNDSYSRVIEIGDAVGSITVTHAPRQSALRVVVRFPRLNELSMIITRVRRMFDLSAEPGAIAAALSCDPALAPLVSARPGLRVPGGWDGFEIAVRAVLGQQISVRAATQLAGRIVATLGDPPADGVAVTGLTHAFPRPQRFDVDALARLGIPRARAAALAGIAVRAANDPRLFDPRRDLDEAIAQLCELPGVGEWTAHYIAMRALGESDAFLAADVGVQRKLAGANGRRPTPLALMKRAEQWRPWRAYAVLHLWTADAGVSQTSSSTKETYHALTA